MIFALAVFPSLFQVGDRSLTAKEGSLSRTMKSSFADLCIKYEDVRNVDRMAAVQASSITGCKDIQLAVKSGYILYVMQKRAREWLGYGRATGKFLGS